MKIKRVDFSKEGALEISKEWYGSNWPVVYILSNEKQVYIGETTSVKNRVHQHLDDPKKDSLKSISVIANDVFNKSAALDIESKLIQYMSADEKYKILNGNSGMKDHNYYDKPFYEAQFQELWQKLRSLDFVKNDLKVLMNSDLFKYTPYKMLTEDQYNIVYEIVTDILSAVQSNETTISIVNGEAGTGKTVIAMYLLKLFTDNEVLNLVSEEDENLIMKFKDAATLMEKFEVAIVVPMSSLRNTLRKVVRGVNGLNSKMIIGPNDVVKKKYDLLIVDESHRLYRRKAITSYGSYDKVNENLNISRDSTQLDWILHSANHVILFYDANQSVRPSDIRDEDFRKLKQIENFTTYSLKSQLRVKGGNDYLAYIKLLLSKTPPKERVVFEDYQFHLFESITDMKNAIVEKNKEIGLSRMVAGFAWKWETKGYSITQISKAELYDIEIEDEKMVWNSTVEGWVISENAINEVGSIHTIQGYDLNYAGVIIGKDIRYDKVRECIIVDKSSYFDTKGKNGLKNEVELENYIINIYSVLLTRGISGTFVYACDPDLREYLSKYISVFPR